MPDPIMPRASKFKSVILTTSFIIMATLVLLEVGMRLLPLVVGDPLRSLINEAKRIPYSNVRILSSRRSNGILLPEASPSEIVVVGDSFPFGTYEKLEDIFPTILEKKIGKKVVNLGIGSQSPPVYNRMIEVGARYNPKVAFYCIFANDFKFGDPEILSLSRENAERELAFDQGLFLRQKTSWHDLSAWMRKLTNFSLAFQFYKVLAQPMAKFHTILWKDDTRTFVFAPTHYWDDLVSWKNPDIKEGVKKVVALVEEARRYATEQGMELEVILQPSKEMVYAPYVGSLGSQIYDESHHETYRQLENALNQKRIPVVDLTPVLRKLAQEGETLYHVIDGHFNVRGHEVTAAVLADRYRAFMEVKTGKTPAQR